MIETQILGSAVGIQRQDVIDKTEGTVLPSLANGVVIGRFKRGRMDKAFKVTNANYKALLGHDPSNLSYMAVEDAFSRGISELSVMRVGSSAGGTATDNGFCKVKASAWSNPITFDMVNKPASNGGVTVDFGGYNYWIDLSEISTTVEFFEKLNQNIYGFDGYKIGVQANIDGSVLVRFEEYIDLDLGAKEELAEYVEIRTVFNKNTSGFYVYDSSNIGNNAESIIYLANAFSETPEFVYCDLPYDGSDS